MRDMVQCEKCGDWYSYKHGCGCTTKEEIEDFLKTYNINDGDEVEFCDGLITNFESNAIDNKSYFILNYEKTNPKRNYAMIRINQVMNDSNTYRILNVNSKQDYDKIDNKPVDTLVDKIVDKKVNVALTLCHKCNGKGYTKEFNGDGHDDVKCEFCKGERVLKQITTVEYEVLP